jgi:hypothetical protein
MLPPAPASNVGEAALFTTWHINVRLRMEVVGGGGARRAGLCPGSAADV